MSGRTGLPGQWLRETVIEATDAQHRRRIDTAPLEQGRLRGSQVVQMLGVSSRAADRWHWAWRREGMAALVRKGPTGPRRLLTQEQQPELRQILALGRCGRRRLDGRTLWNRGGVWTTTGCVGCARICSTTRRGLHPRCRKGRGDDLAAAVRAWLSLAT